MGIIKRAKDIYKANVNSMLDKAENPEAMINQIIRELELATSDLKCNCASRIAESKSLTRQSKELKSVVKRWEGRAELAVTEGKDDLAKDALREKSTASLKLTQINEDLKRFDIDVELNKEQIIKLEEKLVETIKKKKELLARVYRATEKSYTNTVIKKSSGVDVLEKFSRFESKIERMEAEAEIFGSSSEIKFQDLENESKIDSELENLKSKLKTQKKEAVVK